MNYEHLFMFPKIMQLCSKLYAFSLIIDLKVSGKHPFLFVTFDPANLEAIGNKHVVSDSVFKVTRIIE